MVFFVCPRWLFLVVGDPEKAKNVSGEKSSALIGDPFDSVMFSAIAEFYVNEPYVYALPCGKRVRWSPESGLTNLARV